MDKTYIDFEEEIGSANDNSMELFKEGDVTLRTDLNDVEIILSNCLHVENSLIKRDFKKVGVNFDLYGEFLHSFKRHKVSRERRSRSEFVDVNKKNRFDDQLKSMANIKNLTESRT